MARIKLSIPGPSIFTCCVPVRIADINYGNHVGNDSFVSIIHEARMQWLKQYGLTELNIEGSIGFIMADLIVEYKSAAFYGDQVNVSISVGDKGSRNFELYYRLSVSRNEQTVLLGNAKTGLVCYDYETKKPALIPSKIISILHV